MKITKSHLKQIIKEELESVVQEGPHDPYTKAMIRSVQSAIGMINQGKGSEAIPILEGVIEGLTNNP
jgi:hypothetical protein